MTENNPVEKPSIDKPTESTETKAVDNTELLLKSLLDTQHATNELLTRILFGKTEKVADEDLKGDESISRGRIDILKYRDYYDVSNTITTSQATDPNDFDNPNYNIERVHDTLYRNAQQIVVCNDEAAGQQAPPILYVIVSHLGRTNFSHETPIYAQEKKTYWNVYELRLRSATQGHKYRVSEYKIRT